jgi:hypothetical protein
MNPSGSSAREIGWTLTGTRVNPARAAAMSAYDIAVLADKNRLNQAVFFDAFGQLLNSRIIPGNRVIDSLVFWSRLDLIDIALHCKPVHGQVYDFCHEKLSLTTTIQS